MRRLAIVASLILAACSSDSGTASGNNAGGTPWEFDGGGGDATSGGANNGTNTGANNGTNAGVNHGLNNGVTNGANNGASNGTNGGANNGATDAGMPTNNVGGSACQRNSDCGADLICCQGFDGNATCEADCLSGGLCGGDDAECGRGEECCDLSGVNLPDTCLDQCRGGNNMGTPCTTNTDCSNGEVCCLGFDGQGSCTAEAMCFTGGACTDDSECQNGQSCCDFNVAKVCLDRCRF